MFSKIGDSPIAMFKFIYKVFTFENCALVPHSFGLAFIVAEFVNDYIKPSIPIVETLVSIFTTDVIKGLILSLLVFIAGVSMYMVVFIFDFFTGLRASRKEYFISAGALEGYIDQEKLWSSVWKFSAVIIISFILTITSCMLVILEQYKLHQAGMLITLFFFIMVISFDLHSIGDNQKRRFGKKPAFYDRMDIFFRMVGNILLFRIKGLTIPNIKEGEPFKDLDNTDKQDEEDK